MKRWVTLVVCACLAVAAVCALFGPTPTALRATNTVYLKAATPPFPPFVANGTPVLQHGVEIGYVKTTERTLENGVSIELRIFDNVRLHLSDVCVIHRLHRYDTATLYIESGIPANLGHRQPLGDPPVLPHNGPWPTLPGLLEQHSPAYSLVALTGDRYDSNRVPLAA